MTWEYKTESLPPNNADARLNELGNEGWELISESVGGARFKRVKPIRVDAVSARDMDQSMIQQPLSEPLKSADPGQNKPKQWSGGHSGQKVRT